MCEIGGNLGQHLHSLAKKYPRSTFYNADLSERSVAKAQMLAKEGALSNVNHVVQDATKLPGEWSGKFDWVFLMECLHDMGHADKALREFYRILKPKGCLSVIDVNLHCHPRDNINNPLATYFYSYSLFHCMPVALAQPGFLGLGAAYGREKMTELVSAAGFNSVFHPFTDEHVHLLCTKKSKL